MIQLQMHTFFATNRQKRTAILICDHLLTFCTHILSSLAENIAKLKRIGRRISNIDVVHVCLCACVHINVYVG